MTLDEAEKIAAATKNWGFKGGPNPVVCIADVEFSLDEFEAILMCVRDAINRELRAS